MIKNKERLGKLCCFLDSLDPSAFAFESIVASFDEVDGCGTVCCAVGWCPVVFPEDWMWRTSDTVRLRDLRFTDLKALGAAAEYFGLTPDEVDMAFVPWDHSDAFDYILSGYDFDPDREAADKRETGARKDRRMAAEYGYCIEAAGPREVAANIRRVMELES